LPFCTCQSYYRDKDTSPWVLIKSDATNLFYKWTPPTVNGKQVRIKAEVNSQSVYNWAERGGGNTNDKGNSIAVDRTKNLYYFVAGYLTSEASFGSNKLLSRGETDIFISKGDLNTGAFVHAVSGRRTRE